jgi:hypothetical protein
VLRIFKDTGHGFSMNAIQQFPRLNPGNDLFSEIPMMID